VTHHWVVTYGDGGRIEFDTGGEVESCSGSGVVRVTDANHEVVLLLRSGWTMAQRDDIEVVVTPAPEPGSPPTATGRPFA
jgi:hypothetical protein